MDYEKIFNNIINKTAVISVVTEEDIDEFRGSNWSMNIIRSVNIVVTLIGNQKIILNTLTPNKKLPYSKSSYDKMEFDYSSNDWVLIFDYDCNEVKKDLDNRVEEELLRIKTILNCK